MSQLANPVRVVITGLGLVSPLGNTPDELWAALEAGRSGVGPISAMPTANLTTTFAAEARGFTGDIGDFGPLEKEKQKQIRKALKLMCRETQMGVAAAQRALGDAGLPGPAYEPKRIGVVFGSDYMMTLPDEFSAGVAKCTTDGKFSFPQWGDEGMGLLAPLWLLKYLPNMPASHVAIFNDLRGPSNSHTLREASSNLAIGEAAAIIQRGAADAILAGATGTRVHPLRTLHVILQEELAGNGVAPERASRPFDLHRTGSVLGEGAGAVMLERLDTAQARGAKIYGEVVGYGSSFVATKNMVARCDRALANVMQATLRSAKIAPRDVGHIHAHGMSTRNSDAQESRAINEVFGDAAKTVPVTAAKSYFGNLGAGGGAVELIASLLAMQHGKLFPILNYETPDPECSVAAVTDDATPAGASFLKASVTPQGQASAVLVRKV
jgi:3-oxoacyl-[acyl-carrier-protein] synthase II